MNLTTKKTICQALGYKNLFTPATVDRYLQQSTYQYKNDWIKTIQDGKTCFYVTAPRSDIAKRPRANFKLLSLLQVHEFEDKVHDAQLARYLRMQLALNDGANIMERQKFQNMVNKFETKLMRAFAADGISPEDARIFLMTAVIFGDRYFLYDHETEVCLSNLLKLLN